jgi:hypothetical protein
VRGDGHVTVFRTGDTATIKRTNVGRDGGRAGTFEFIRAGTQMTARVRTPEGFAENTWTNAITGRLAAIFTLCFLFFL